MLKLAPKIGKRQMTVGPTVPRSRVRCLQVTVQVQWSTAKLTLSCQLKRNKQARRNESCRSIPSRRHIAADFLFLFTSEVISPRPRPVPRPRPRHSSQPPFAPSRTQQAVFRKPPALASSILLPVTAPHRTVILSRRIALHHLASPGRASVLHIRYPTYRLHDLHNTLYPSSLVSSSHTLDTLVSCPPGDSGSTITALLFQNLFSREGDRGPAVSPQRTSSY